MRKKGMIWQLATNVEKLSSQRQKFVLAVWRETKVYGM
jgi:hypothetical protein